MRRSGERPELVPEPARHSQSPLNDNPGTQPGCELTYSDSPIGAGPNHRDGEGLGPVPSAPAFPTERRSATPAPREW